MNSRGFFQQSSHSHIEVKVPVAKERWSSEKVLTEARARTKALNSDNARQVSRMLAGLMEEAGWDEEDFIQVLCADVIKRGTH